MTFEPPLLLTPGPLTTAPGVRRAMARDWGSRDAAFIALTQEVRDRLLALAYGEATHVATPLQGSGTYAVEAALGTLIRPTDRLLVLVNGAYGERMDLIARRLRLHTTVLRFRENQPIDPDTVKQRLAEDPGITHVGLVHCETTTGILNPLDVIAKTVAGAGRRLLVDSMSAFGALPLDLRRTPVGAVMASSNKCLQGVPGVAFVLAERDWLESSAGVSPSTCLDLHAQWQALEADGQWRFTPPVQVVAALAQALRDLEAEGGPAVRLRRYEANLDALLAAASRAGLRPFLARAVQAPIIVTFHAPTSGFDFGAFYRALLARGFAIYPGKLTQAQTFRIGCIGDIVPADFERLSGALGPALAEAIAGRTPPPGPMRLGRRTARTARAGSDATGSTQP